MGRVAKIIAFLFRLLNFILDLLQTWQFAGSGGMGGVITFIISWFQGMPIWAVILLSLAVSIIIAIILSLVFTTFRRKKFEDNELRKLPRLAHDIHKRVCTVRNRLIKRTDWDSLDRDMVIKPLTEILFDKELDQEELELAETELDDDALDTMAKRLKKVGELTHGASSVLDTYMRDSDTSLEKALQKDLQYRILMARLDNHKPYPSDAIRNSVQIILDSTISFNNVIIWLSYFPVEKPLSITKISNEKKQQIYIVNKNAEKNMNDTIDIGTTNLRTHIRDYLKQGSNK
ncbi:hypothetical protein ES708_07764 [subsurface metagenome]